MGIPENIKRLRLKHELTQAELGKIAGVTDKAVSTWESGAAAPRMGAIEKIAKHFNISKSEIIEDELADDTPGHFLDPEAAELAQEMYDRPELKTLFSTTRNVSREDLEVVQQIVDRIAKAKNGPDDDPA